MNDGVVFTALAGAISSLFAFSVYLIKRMLDAKEAECSALKTERDACLAQKDALKDEARETVRSYLARDQAELDRRRKGGG